MAPRLRPGFHPLPHQTQHADFPHCAFLVAWRQGLWDLSHWACFRSAEILDSVISEQVESLLQPCPTPPFPAEARAISGTHQMPTELLLDPIADVTKTPTGVTDSEVVHPTTQHRVDQ